jgi:pimeloyl-ACP methyl ester carboxylesterase
MIRIRKRVPPRVSRPPELIRRARNLLFLIIFLGMFVLGFNRVMAYEDGIQRSTFTIQGAIPVPVLEMRPASGETALVVVIAHGFAGSKELMTDFGAELARAGITTYLFDFPGHGESPVPLTDNTFSERTAQENIIWYTSLFQWSSGYYRRNVERADTCLEPVYNIADKLKIYALF